MHPLRPRQSPVHASPANTASALAPQKANRWHGTTLGDSPILDSLGIPCDSRRAESALTLLSLPSCSNNSGLVGSILNPRSSAASASVNLPTRESVRLSAKA